MAGHNRASLGVCLIGGHGSAADDEPGAHFTAEQLRAARLLVEERLVAHPGAVVRGHNEVSAKACPGFRARLWWAGEIGGDVRRVVTVEDVQVALRDLGFDPGPPDGALGPRTRAAALAFSLRAGLTGPAEPTLALREALQAALAFRGA